MKIILLECLLYFKKVLVTLHTFCHLFLSTTLESKYNFPYFKKQAWGFPGGAVVKNPPANAGDTVSSPDPGRSHMPRSN